MRIRRIALLGLVALGFACTTVPDPGERTAKVVEETAVETIPEPPERWSVDPDRPGPAIGRVAARPKRFDPDLQPIEISFELGEPAAETEVAIRTEAGDLIRVLPLPSAPAGRHSVPWDGKGPSGRSVPSGVYVFEIRARGSTDAVSVWRAHGAGGAEIQPHRFTYDAAQGTVRYLLPRAGRVRLRAGLSGLPFVATLLDWEPQEAGRHEVAWDGMDSDGVMRLGQDPRAELMLHAFELPADAVVLDRGDGPLGRGNASPTARGFRHARHDPAWCHDLAPVLGFPELDQPGVDSTLVLSEDEVVRVSLEADDAEHLTDVGFEVLVFIDTTFVFQEAEASNPFNYTLDVSRLPAGPHVLTVNVLSTDDHAGFSSLAFIKQ